MVSESPRDRVVDSPPPGGIADTWPPQDVVVEAGVRRAQYATTGVTVADTILPVRNRVQWGPILAGVATTMTAMLLFTALGLAIGASAFEPGTDVTDWGTGAGIYGIVAALVSFFIGGWMAAKTAAVSGEFAGLTNGLIAGAASLMILVWLSTTGLANLVGFLGANLNNIADFVGNEGGAAATDTGVSFNDVERGAWITFFVVLAALAASAVGGWLGHNDRAELEQGA
ncbi:MAG: hypothetical protein QOJ59_2798 [Thermomicrobiales bacterium]|jgi:hypothetical protein|nr:hypothetical protein [Thermomicrobiales bacterium]